MLACLLRGRFISCLVNPQTGRELQVDLSKVEHPKKVMIVGGGIAGLEAARAAATRGHSVVLYEKQEFLGGQFKAAAYPPCKGDLASYIAWLNKQMEDLAVTIHLNTEVTEELIREENPDKVILATGGTGLRPGIKGIDLPNVVSAEDILLGKIQPADQIVVAGGGEVGLETAAHLAIEELDGCAFPVDPHGLYSFRFLRQLRKSAAFDRFHDDGLPPMFPYHIITELSSCFFCLNSLESFLSKLSGKICQHLGYFDLLGTYLLTGTALKAGRRLLFRR